MSEALKLKPGHIQGETGVWEMVIGLEIHVQLDCDSKMFSKCRYEYDNSPNSLTCPTSFLSLNKIKVGTLVTLHFSHNISFSSISMR